MIFSPSHRFPSSGQEPNDIGLNFIALAENANDGMLVIVGQGVIAYANPYAASMVGKRTEAVIGRSIKDFLPADEQERVASIFHARMQGKPAPDRYSTVILGKSTKIPVELTVAKTTWADEPASFVIIRDIR